MPLIYHTQKEKYSVFEGNILKVVKHDHIKIACPYISTELIKGWVSGKTDWKFLTDFHELVRSLKSNTKRIEFLEFFKENQVNIRHIKMLHAKVIMSNKNMLFGSANFTETGLTKRTELSYFSDNLETVQEINSWFDSLWEEAKENPTFDEIANLVSSYSNRKEVKIEPEERVEIFSYFKPLNKLLLSDKNKLAEIKALPQNSEAKLKLILQKFDPDFINKFLDKSKELFEFLGLKADDPRFRTSTPKNTEYLLTIAIGKNRFAIVAKNGSKIDLIMPLNYLTKISKNDEVKINHQGNFTSNKKGNPVELKYIGFDDLNLSDEVFKLWKIACKEEIERNHTVNGREKDHNPFFYKAIVDIDYRESILKNSEI